MYEEKILAEVGELKQIVLRQSDHICRLEAWIEENCSRQNDVIESGGVKNITYNNYYENDFRKIVEPNNSYQTVPDVLNTDKAQTIKQKIARAGMLDEKWQPIDLSGPECAILAKVICEHLKIDEVWQVFGGLSGQNPTTLRSYFNRAMNQKKTLDFQDKLKKSLSC